MLCSWGRITLFQGRIEDSLSHGSKYLQYNEKFLGSSCYAVEMLCHQVVTGILQVTRVRTHELFYDAVMCIKNMVHLCQIILAQYTSILSQP